MECDIGLDIFGSCFFMLSRYEEAIKSDRDNHDRFPAKASLASQEGFLDRPIVNEYLEILWKCINHLWPNIRRKQRSFKMRVTADVDQPYGCSIQTPTRFLRQLVGDLLIRESPKQAVRSLINGFRIKRGNFSFDQNYSMFDWMMDVNERANNKMTFYFLAGISSHKADGCYSLDEPIIRKLLTRIHSRGHEIGLHPSYETYQDAELISLELQTLQRVLAEEKIIQDNFRSRQHYLRWKTPTTSRILALAGVQYDSTLSFADHAGFRSGVCYEYQMYDVIEKKTLDIRERPLIVMECTVIGKAYMNERFTDRALQVMKFFRRACSLYCGAFVILWHNSFFYHDNSRQIYSNIIDPSI
jgi:hypothetical protein